MSLSLASKTKIVMRTLIINADDLGLSDYVNSQIERCIELGVVTSSSLMANAPAFEEGVKIAKRHTSVSVGVHLNLIEFAPLTNREVFQKHGLLDSNGNFIDGAALAVSYDEALKQAVFEEWDAQITKIEEAGLIPTHCDSHEHTHAVEALQEVLCKVMDKHNITKLRRRIVPSIRLILRESKQTTTVQFDKSNTVQPKRRNVIYRRIHFFVVKYKSWNWNRKMSKRYKLTNASYSFQSFYSNRDVLHLGGKSSFVELMVHPGNIPFQGETDLLMKDKSWLDNSYTLGTYRNL